MQRGGNREVYNVADGNPTTMTDYLYRVADAVGVARPPCVPLAEAAEKLSPGMLSFIRESRRLLIDKLVTDLGVELKYPDLDRGLVSCLPDFSEP